MTSAYLAPILLFYGIFLISCGIVSVIFIGMKAKTALVSGGMSGAISLVLAYLAWTGFVAASWIGIGLSFALLIVFSWRSTKTLLKVLELIPTSHPELNAKGIAFLIISLMAVVSIFVLMLQCILLLGT
ncbi:MAG: hypothetical protein ABIS36_20895 [Chryseolinea sp.]